MQAETPKPSVTFVKKLGTDKILCQRKGTFFVLTAEDIYALSLIAEQEFGQCSTPSISTSSSETTENT